MATETQVENDMIVDSHPEHQVSDEKSSIENGVPIIEKGVVTSDAAEDAPKGEKEGSEGAKDGDVDVDINDADATIDELSTDPHTICETDPNFSAICSFFLKFGQSLGISYSIDDLKLMLEDKTHGECFRSCLSCDN